MQATPSPSALAAQRLSHKTLTVNALFVILIPGRGVGARASSDPAAIDNTPTAIAASSGARDRQWAAGLAMKWQ